VKQTVFSGPCSSYAFIRLELLSAKFNLHILLNGTRELNASKSVPHRDFYNVRKVDTHVHHSVSTLICVLIDTDMCIVYLHEDVRYYNEQILKSGNHFVSVSISHLIKHSDSKLINQSDSLTHLVTHSLTFSLTH
jgi:AMP deaminase